MNKIEIIEKEIGNVIEIEEIIPMWKMPSIMGKDFNQILEYYKSKNIKDTGIPYARYIDVNWKEQVEKSFFANLIEVFTKKWHFYVGIPVPKKVDSNNNLKSNFIKNKKYIQTIHYGAYHKVGDTYKTMYNWSQKENIKLESESIEFYLNDPNIIEKEKLETMILIPIEDKD